MTQSTIERVDFADIGARFGINTGLVSALPHGSGHINETYRATYAADGKQLQFVHQRINNEIFSDSAALMSNIVKVTSHQRQKLEAQGVSDIDRRVLSVVHADDGRPFIVDTNGEHWRTYRLIESARSYDQIESTQQAYCAAAAFAKFQEQLLDLDPDQLHVTIPGFHSISNYFEQLHVAVSEDSHGRVSKCEREIEFAMSRASAVTDFEQMLASGALPRRIVHNDTKLNNVLFDDKSGDDICVIDLDTVMSGTVLADFGDLVRSAANRAAEDEPDWANIRLDVDVFEALARGYLETAKQFLTETELEHLAMSSQVITLECGMRFLTDFLSGDSYFKTHRAGQNLDRCRVQFALVSDIEGQRAALESMIEQIAKAG